jgi:hypothetical protein
LRGSYAVRIIATQGRDLFVSRAHIQPIVTQSGGPGGLPFIAAYV